jgi:hypothetical protein
MVSCLACCSLLQNPDSDAEYFGKIGNVLLDALYRLSLLSAF